VLVQVPLGSVARVEKMGGQSSKQPHAYGITVFCKVSFLLGGNHLTSERLGHSHVREWQHCFMAGNREPSLWRVTVSLVYDKAGLI
jgi:hypothetical protein